jgi:hypothetical protein
VSRLLVVYILFFFPFSSFRFHLSSFIFDAIPSRDPIRNSRAEPMSLARRLTALPARNIYLVEQEQARRVIMAGRDTITVLNPTGYPPKVTYQSLAPRL